MTKVNLKKLKIFLIDIIKRRRLRLMKTEELIEKELPISIKSISEPEVDKNGRTQAEKNEFKQVIKGFSEVECEEAVKILPDKCLWDELFRRNSAMLQKINQIEEALGVNMDNIKPIPINTWMEIRERYEDLEKKFVRVKKLGGN